jgi:hypothetical protein
LKRLLVFALPFLAAFVVFDWRLNQVPDEFGSRRDLLLQRKEDLEILLLGSSHGARGFDPHVFRRPAFNLAEPFQSLIIDSRLARTLMPQLPRLRWILVPLSLFSHGYRTVDSETARDLVYRYQYSWGFLGDAPAWRYLNAQLFSATARHGIAESKRIAAGGFRPFPAETDALGWIRSTGSDARNFSPEAGRRRVLLHFGLVRPHVEEDIDQEMDALLEEARRRGVKVLLVVSPAHPFYQRYVDRHTEAQLEARLWRFADRFPDVVRTQNDLRRSGFETLDFIDVDHLNSRGAQKWSKALDVLLQ